MTKKFKKPTLNSSSSIKSREIATVSYQQQPPIFSLKYMYDSHCIKKCTKEEKAAFADKLRELSQITWNQIFNAHRHGLGFEVIARDSIQSPIPSHITEDVKIIAFRCIGKVPMVGYRDEAVFHIIWIDREFKLYKHS